MCFVRSFRILLFECVLSTNSLPGGGVGSTYMGNREHCQAQQAFFLLVSYRPLANHARSSAASFVGPLQALQIYASYYSSASLPQFTYRAAAQR